MRARAKLYMKLTMGGKTRRSSLSGSLSCSGLERWIAHVSLILGRLSRRVGPPIKNLRWAPCRWRVLIVARHDAATRALQDTLRTLDESGARMKRQQAPRQIAPIGTSGIVGRSLFAVFVRG